MPTPKPPTRGAWALRPELRPFVALLCLAGAACSESPPTAPDPCTSVGSITVGESQSGTLAAGDCVQMDGALGDRWSLQLSSPSDVYISLVTPAFDGVIELQDGFGTALAWGVDGVNPARVIEALPAGSYLVLVRGTYAGAAGSYTLRVSPAPDCSTVGSIEIGNTVTGALGEGDCLRQWEGRADRWALSVPTEQRLRFDLVAPGFDEILLVEDDYGSIWFGTDWLNPVGHASATMLVPAGDWVLNVTTPFDASVGDYELTVDVLPPCTPGTELSLGETVTGSLDTSDCLFESWQPADSFAITLADETPVRFHLKSLDFQPLLVVRDSLRQEVVFAYDQMNDGNAIERAGLAPGKYSLVVTGFPSAGGYSLTVEEIVCDVPQPIGFGETVTGTLDSTDCLRAGGQSQESWQLVLADDTTVRIDLTSSSFDPYLILKDGSGAVLASDDDGGPSVNARIERALVAGTYEIVASSFSASGAGSYQLTVGAPPTPGLAASPEATSGRKTTTDSPSPYAAGEERLRLLREEARAASERWTVTPEWDAR